MCTLGCKQEEVKTTTEHVFFFKCNRYNKGMVRHNLEFDHKYENKQETSRLIEVRRIEEIRKK